MSIRLKSQSSKQSKTSNNKNNTGRIHYCRTATQIGEGGFGIVIKCNNKIKQSNNTHPVPNEFVLKLPKYYPIHMAEHEGGNEIRKAYDQILESHAAEARLCKSLSHPNILASYDLDIQPEDIEDDLEAIKRSYDIHMWSTYLTQIFQSGNPKYLTMEYCNLGDLNSVYHMLNNMSYFDNELLSNEDITSFRNKLATTLVFGVGNAICYLHELKTKTIPLGIVHNDIKAENIMVHYNTSNKTVTAKLADFGLAFIPTQENPSLYGSEKDATMNIGTVIYTPFHLLHNEQISFIERQMSSMRNSYKIGKDIHVNPKILNTDYSHNKKYRLISYFSDWFAYMNVITMLFSNMFINNELVLESSTQTQTIILYGMLNTIDTVNEMTHDSTLFKTLLLYLKNIEYNLYEGNDSVSNNNSETNYKDVLKNYAKLHNWFRIYKASKITNWSDLQVRFVNYKTHGSNNNNVSSLKVRSDNSTSSEKKNSLIKRFKEGQKSRLLVRAAVNKPMQKSLKRKSSLKKSQTKKISGYLGSFNESNVAL